ncbi:hypothetical protein [Thiolapillus sp.]
MFAIVPRETFLPLCWPLLAFLPLCWPLCRSAVLLVYVCLLASLPLYWPLCRSDGLSIALFACCVCFGLPGDSRLPVSLSANAWCFSAGGYIAACC